MQDTNRPGPNRGTIELANAIASTLCHIGELIDVAHEIACDMHGGMNSAAAILQVSGRLATLMHSATREVNDAQQIANELLNL